MEFPCDAVGPYIGSGYRFSAAPNAMVNKVGYMYYGMMFGGRCEIAHYTDFSRNAWAIWPELGFAYAGAFSVFYGYRMALNNNDYFQLKGHVLSVGVLMSKVWLSDDKN